MIIFKSIFDSDLDRDPQDVAKDESVNYKYNSFDRMRYMNKSIKGGDTQTTHALKLKKDGTFSEISYDWNKKNRLKIKKILKAIKK